MPIYLIVKKDSPDLEAIVFTVEDDEASEAVAVFTDPERCKNYVADAEWTDEYTIAEVESIDFVEWLIGCYREGVELMAVDPDYKKQVAGQRMETLVIPRQLEQAGLHILQIANPDF